MRAGWEWGFWKQWDVKGRRRRRRRRFLKKKFVKCLLLFFFFFFFILFFFLRKCLVHIQIHFCIFRKRCLTFHFSLIPCHKTWQEKSRSKEPLHLPKNAIIHKFTCIQTPCIHGCFLHIHTEKKKCQKFSLFFFLFF